MRMPAKKPQPRATIPMIARKRPSEVLIALPMPRENALTAPPPPLGRC